VSIQGKTIVVAITGGIAAVKAVRVCSALVQHGAVVRVLMTAGACRFVTPLALQAIVRTRVISDIFAEDDASVIAHIDIADRADACVIAPATAHALASLALGLGDGMAAAALLAIGTRVPVIAAPAMNRHMWANAVVQQHVATLRARGVVIVPPTSGFLACGDEGTGRMAEPDDIVETVVHTFAHPLRGKRVIVTAGGTFERIDAVRGIANASSGKMGIALARAAQQRGADVTLIYGTVSVPLPERMTCIYTQCAKEMADAVFAHFDQADIVIMAAAVADYTVAQSVDHKMKKTNAPLSLQLVPTIDILAALGARKTHQRLIGCAAETEHVVQYAREKCVRKQCDAIIANDVRICGFGADENEVTIVTRDTEVALPRMPKTELAHRIWDIIAAEEGQ
jgi:phosphopantothenoylcysteine decarboxylase/phosphopantothenate--cysteine ligase